MNLLEHFKTVDQNNPTPIQLTEKLKLDVYPKSVNKINDDFFFIGTGDQDKFLWILSKSSVVDSFEGTITDQSSDGYSLKQCPINATNAKELRKLFSFTNPILIGADNSFGFGDRLGVAGPAHLRAVLDSGLKPILAQQSIRELQRTQRTAQEVMDAASWAVFQEGYQDGFGSDADHIKTTEDIDLMLQAGFLMFTIDPGSHVDNAVDSYSESELNEKLKKLPWKDLEDSVEKAVKRYVDQKIDLGKDFSLSPSKLEVSRAFVKYGSAVSVTKKLYQHLANKISSDAFELEISVDETDSDTTPFEHYFMANELQRLGVKFVSLAPRFIGGFEKGIDYKGDLTIFKQEYRKHLAITRALGGYKISLHSGSDKFKVYNVIGSLKDEGKFHIKTAGTSYLEALRTVAKNDPSLFRSILDFSKGIYATERATYHVSADENNVPDAEDCNDQKLLTLLDDDATRQVLHVAFGRVLTTKSDDGELLFKNKILDCLKEHEADHYQLVEKHLKRHIKPFLS
jgi:tagaturonate epimerase